MEMYVTPETTYLFYEEEHPMKRKSKLLHVVSIIVIVFDALAVLSGILSFLMKDIVNQSYEMLGMTPPTTLYYVWALVFACFELAAGIAGVMYKSRKSVFVFGVIWCILVVANLVYASISSGFSFLYIFDLILPVLYIWGVYQSE